MFKKNELHEIELDHALAKAESGKEGELMQTLRVAPQPRTGFIRHLERQLRQDATRATPQPQLTRLVPQLKSLLPILGASLALLVLLGSLFWLNQPEAVSAQLILERAAASQLAPNQIVHRVYRLEQTFGNAASGSGDVWIKANADGAGELTAMTFTSFAADGSALEVERTIIEGDNVEAYVYDIRENSVLLTQGTFEQVMGDQPNYFDGASVAKYLSRIAQGDVEGVQLLASQTWNGVPVQVIRMKGEHGPNFYFDATSYVLQGVEGPGLRAWLLEQQIVEQKDVPSDAFVLNVPANARVVQDKSNMPRGTELELQAILEVCQLTQDKLDAGIKMGQTPLEICQSSLPAMTQAQFVTELSAPVHAQAAADVAAGKMTAQEQSEYLSLVRNKLGAWATVPLTNSEK